MHLINMAHNVLGASAVVGTTIPDRGRLRPWRSSARRPDSVSVAFFGDGATEEGRFPPKAYNFAALQKLPVLFVCENNYYAIHTPITRRWATNRLCERVATYGIPAYQVENGDVLKLRELAAEAVARMRRGEGPAFIECQTYRWREHVGPNEDFDQGYRARDDLHPWMKEDQVARLAKMLPDDRRAAIDSDIELEIQDAIAFAESSPFPSIEKLNTNVFAGE